MAKGVLTFDSDRCKGCELCVANCPVKILALDMTRVNAKGYNPAYIAQPEKCIGCTNCAVMCPDVVITIERGDV